MSFTSFFSLATGVFLVRSLKANTMLSGLMCMLYYGINTIGMGDIIKSRGTYLSWVLRGSRNTANIFRL